MLLEFVLFLPSADLLLVLPDGLYLGLDLIFGLFYTILYFFQLLAVRS